MTACADEEAICPYTGKRDDALSAGCFAVSDHKLLLVQGLNGAVSVPGGSSKPGESAQCTAFRETWEETGLRLQPRELLRVFDTGFHLYRCERHASSGEIDPREPFEVRSAFYLGAHEFEKYEWRYGQREIMRTMLLYAQPVSSD